METGPTGGAAEELNDMLANELSEQGFIETEMTASPEEADTYLDQLSSDLGAENVRLVKDGGMYLLYTRMEGGLSAETENIDNQIGATHASVQDVFGDLKQENPAPPDRQF